MVPMIGDVTQRLGGMAPLLLFLLLLILQIVLRFLPSGGSKKRLSNQEAELVRQIKQLNREADALNTPATFAKSSKLRRAALAKEKELALIKQSSAGGDSNWLSKKLSLPLAIKAIVILGVGGWFRQINVASVPASLLQPFGGMLAVKERNSDMVQVSIIPWMILSTTVASYLVDSVWRVRRA
ncbi:hypothetical protein M758_4G187000 [Ceratodon purpureus]|nr:hypothetical protein M758_4G187000 [Ceratodon purpureus]